jgi:hypothetical protein
VKVSAIFENCIEYGIMNILNRLTKCAKVGKIGAHAFSTHECGNVDYKRKEQEAHIAGKELYC